MYGVVAEQALRTSEFSILDVGVLVCCEGQRRVSLSSQPRSDPYTPTVGRGPFSYFAHLAKIAGVPPLMYSWLIQTTRYQTAPFIEISLNTGGKMQVRDESKLGYEEIPETNAWTDDGGQAEYVWMCELSDIPPKWEIATRREAVSFLSSALAPRSVFC